MLLFKKKYKKGDLLKNKIYYTIKKISVAFCLFDEDFWNFRGKLKSVFKWAIRFLEWGLFKCDFLEQRRGCIFCEKPKRLLQFGSSQILQTQQLSIFCSAGIFFVCFVKKRKNFNFFSWICMTFINTAKTMKAFLSMFIFNEDTSI